MGIHRTVRRILSLTSDYYLVTAKTQCNICEEAHIQTHPDIIKQLNITQQYNFPCTLTYRQGVDNSVLALMSERTKGNSPSQLIKQVLQNHLVQYLQACNRYMRAYRNKLDIPKALPDPPPASKENVI